MTTTSPVALAALARAEPATWRDVPTVARLWARAFARGHSRRFQRGRRLGVLARYPRSLALAIVLRRRTVLLRAEPPGGPAGACLTLHRPASRTRPLLLLAFLAAVVVIGGLDSAAGLIGPIALALSLAVLLGVGRAPIRGAVRTVRDHRQAVSHPPADIEIANLAAHPRGSQLGTDLLDLLIGVLDRDHLAAQLEARSTRVAAWYADVGFLSAPQHPRSLHMYRPRRSDTNRESSATTPGPASAPASSLSSSARSGASRTQDTG